MQDSEGRQIDRSQRVQEFAVNQPTAFPARSHAAEVLAAHAAAVAQAKEAAARQDAAQVEYQESTEQKNAAIKSLVELMRAMNQTSRSINKQIPGIADKFRMPPFVLDS